MTYLIINSNQQYAPGDTKGENMRNWKKTVVIFLLIICPIVIFVLVSFISGKAISEYVGFAVDSSERLYVGTNAGIEVYENGVRIKTINPPSSRSYVFTIEDEKIVGLKSKPKFLAFAYSTQGSN